MAYKAEIVSVELKNDKLVATVHFTNPDNGEAFSDTFDTTQKQDKSWPQELVLKKLDTLNHFHEIKDEMPLGEVTEITASDAKKMNKEEQSRSDYHEKLVSFERLINAIAKGFTNEQSDLFVETKQWLTDNFKSDYLDMF